MSTTEATDGRNDNEQLPERCEQCGRKLVEVPVCAWCGFDGRGENR